MLFKLTPVLDKMEALYQQPRSRARFEAYLTMLQGDQKGELILPIGGYNPMAKEHVLERLRELQKLKAEGIVEEEIERINEKLGKKQHRTLEVVLNLADDVGGAWTNRYATDYSSKFELRPLINRNFCTPYFWTSEAYTEDLISQRTRAYMFRSVYRLTHNEPTCLQDYVAQEVFVWQNIEEKSPVWEEKPLIQTKKFYEEHAHSDDYNLLFNFFYGDEASKSLEYPCYGMSKQGGFSYAAYLSRKG